jgi:hypothetical protein
MKRGCEERGERERREEFPGPVIRYNAMKKVKKRGRIQKIFNTI